MRKKKTMEKKERENESIRGQQSFHIAHFKVWAHFFAFCFDSSKPNQKRRVIDKKKIAAKVKRKFSTRFRTESNANMFAFGIVNVV